MWQQRRRWWWAAVACGREPAESCVGISAPHNPSTATWNAPSRGSDARAGARVSSRASLALPHGGASPTTPAAGALASAPDARIGLIPPIHPVRACLLAGWLTRFIVHRLSSIVQASSCAQRRPPAAWPPLLARYTCNHKASLQLQACSLVLPAKAAPWSDDATKHELSAVVPPTDGRQSTMPPSIIPQKPVLQATGSQSWAELQNHGSACPTSNNAQRVQRPVLELRLSTERDVE